MNPRKTKYVAEVWCPNCGTYQKVDTSNTQMLVIPCSGCGGNNLYTSNTVLHLTDEELKALTKGRELTACGTVQGVDLSERYQGRPDFTEERVAEEISKLIGDFDA